ncbi:MAG: zinc ribbon domain-containing protein, partial [Oscillospiraceae bacterium]|nr:zinc ribbon domain-containing protein [Oscillospiraceae bacterium]
RELGCFGNKYLAPKLSCFSTKIKCGNCGRSFLRSARKRGSYVIWTCGSKKGRGKSCGARDIPEKLLQGVCTDILDTGKFDGIAFAERIESVIIIGKDTMEFHFYDGEVKSIKWKSNAKKTMWTPERKALWSEYNYHGGRNGTGLGFNEFIQRKERDGEWQEK